MGLPRLNNKVIVTPQDEMTVAEFKKLAELSELERIYELPSGHVLEDNQLIDTREASYGSTTDWERG